MFGTRTRAPRPVLLILVYGAFLAIVGAAATAQSILVGAHFNSATLTGLVGSDVERNPALARCGKVSDARTAGFVNGGNDADASLIDDSRYVFTSRKLNCIAVGGARRNLALHGPWYRDRFLCIEAAGEAQNQKRGEANGMLHGMLFL